MSHIRGRDTAPERKVRSHLHRAGLRFRLHVASLPGRPDLVLPKWGVVVFVHGCFWHRHPNCDKTYTPKSNRHFWESKFSANVVRDRVQARALVSAGWRVFTVWECETTSPRLNTLVRRIRHCQPARRSR